MNFDISVIIFLLYLHLFAVWLHLYIFFKSNFEQQPLFWRATGRFYIGSWSVRPPHTAAGLPPAHKSLTLDLFVAAKLLCRLRLTHPNGCKCEYGHLFPHRPLSWKKKNPDVLIINICTPGLQSPLMCPDISPQQKYVAYLPSPCQTHLHFHSSNEQMMVAECVSAYLRARVCGWAGSLLSANFDLVADYQRSRLIFLMRP